MFSSATVASTKSSSGAVPRGSVVALALAILSCASLGVCHAQGMTSPTSGDPAASKTAPLGAAPAAPSAAVGGTLAGAAPGGQATASPGPVGPVGPDGIPVAGTTPAGQPTPDQPMSRQQTDRTIPPGPTVTSWDTFEYEGPDLHYSVIGEVRQGQILTVLGCANGWCNVSFDDTSGYILAEVVATGNPALPAPGFLPQPAADLIAVPPGPCVEVIQTEGNGGTKPTRFCQKQAQ